MRNRSIIALLLLLMSALAVPVYAVKVNVYEVQLPVASQTPEARNDASQHGLEQVLLRLTSDKNITSNPVIKENLSKAGYFVQEYRYASPSPNSSEYQIYIRFDPTDINRLLNQAGVAYWKDDRPLILAFLTLKKPNGDVDIIGDDETNPIAKEIKHYSHVYGLPLILPVLDMEDLNQFSAEDISGMLLPALKTAGKRYAPDVYLIGNIAQAYGGYDSRWELISNSANKAWSWTMSDRSSDTIISNVLEQVSQNLSNHHVVKRMVAADIWIKLEISNIAERDELTHLLQYLKELHVVRDVQLSQVSNDSIKIAVLVRGSLDTFQQNVKEGNHLILKGEHADANILQYDWVR